MSTEQYPEVSGDESGIVPQQPQTARSPEWPKKIRTLTASELDRLTIDGSGRFYWDGQLVNYEPPQQPKKEPTSAEPHEQSAMDIIDRAVSDLADQKAPTTIEGAELPVRLNTDIEPVRMATDTPTFAELPMAAAPMQVVGRSDGMRLSLSTWQTLAAVVALVALVIGSAGVAAYGYVAMRDWSCRLDAKQSSCPPPPVVRPRIEIPA